MRIKICYLRAIPIAIMYFKIILCMRKSVLVTLLVMFVCTAQAQFSTAYVTGGISLMSGKVAPQISAGYSLAFGDYVDIGALFEYNSVECKDDDGVHSYKSHFDEFAYYGTLDVWFLNAEAVRLGAYVAPGYVSLRSRGWHYDDCRYSGFAGKLGLKGQVPLCENLCLLFAAGGQLLPEFDGWYFERSKFGAFAQAGLAVRF